MSIPLKYYKYSIVIIIVIIIILSILIISSHANVVVSSVFILILTIGLGIIEYKLNSKTTNINANVDSSIMNDYFTDYNFICEKQNTLNSKIKKIMEIFKLNTSNIKNNMNNLLKYITDTNRNFAFDDEFNNTPIIPFQHYVILDRKYYEITNFDNDAFIHDIAKYVDFKKSLAFKTFNLDIYKFISEEFNIKYPEIEPFSYIIVHLAKRQDEINSYQLKINTFFKNNIIKKIE